MLKADDKYFIEGPGMETGKTAGMGYRYRRCEILMVFATRVAPGTVVSLGFYERMSADLAVG